MDEVTWLIDERAGTPTNRRTITIEAFEDGELLEVVGRLTDERPDTDLSQPARTVHDMELCLKVERDTFTISAVRATMLAHPHEDCSDIESAFGQLVGVSVSQGYSRSVQALVGRERGCSHLEFLARAMGPVVIQGISMLRAPVRTAPAAGEEFSAGPWMKNTCHIWAEDGPAAVKLRLGWRPGTVSPVPRLEVFEAEQASKDG